MSNKVDILSQTGRRSCRLLHFFTAINFLLLGSWGVQDTAPELLLAAVFKEAEVVKCLGSLLDLNKVVAKVG